MNSYDFTGLYIHLTVTSFENIVTSFETVQDLRFVQKKHVLEPTCSKKNSGEPKNRGYFFFPPSDGPGQGPCVSLVFCFPLFFIYAQILILVNLILVNLFTKMDIARNPGGGQVPGVVQMNPTGLPELFKPTRDQNKRQKCEKMRF